MNVQVESGIGLPGRFGEWKMEDGDWKLKMENGGRRKIKIENGFWKLIPFYIFNFSIEKKEAWG